MTRLGDRSGNRHPEFQPGRRGLVLDLRDAPEGEERDRTDRHVAGTRHERVRQLVEQQGDEEEHGRQDGGRPDREGRPVRTGERELRRERHRDETRDDEPAVVETDVDAEDASELDADWHGRPSGPLEAARPARVAVSRRGPRQDAGRALPVGSAADVASITRMPSAAVLPPGVAPASWSLAASRVALRNAGSPRAPARDTRRGPGGIARRSGAAAPWLGASAMPRHRETLHRRRAPIAAAWRRRRRAWVAGCRGSAGRCRPRFEAGARLLACGLE